MLIKVVSLAPAIVLVLALGYAAVRHQRLFLVLFMFLTALENTRDFAPSVGMSLWGVSLYPDDLIAVTCIGAALGSIGQWRLRGTTRTAVLVLTLLVGLGVITWISTYGLQKGTNSWRDEVLNVALLLYVTTRPRAWEVVPGLVEFEWRSPA
jgi:hypothetical protein